MAVNKLNLLNSAKVKEELLAKQQKDISIIYKHSHDNINKELDKLKGKQNISSILMVEELNQLKSKIAKEYKISTGLVKEAIEGNMESVCTEVVNDSKDLIGSMGFDIKEAFSYVPKDVVRNISSGKIYQEDWQLTKALWGDDQKKLHEINQIIAEGVAQNKTTLEMAKDLEKYVNPEAKKPWDWGKVYPGVRTKIDYNAQRLARTLVNHAYQQSVIETSKPNPFVEGIKWLSDHGERTCQLCIERSQQNDYGLGEGVFPKDQVPLDHPNGLCSLASVITESLDNIADRISEWAKGNSDEELDNFANALYNTDKFTNVATTKVKAMTKEEFMASSGFDKQSFENFESYYGDYEIDKIEKSLQDAKDILAKQPDSKLYAKKVKYFEWKKSVAQAQQNTSPLEGMNPDTLKYLEGKYGNAATNVINMQIHSTKWNIDNNYPSSSSLGIQYDKDKLLYLEEKKKQLAAKKKVVTIVDAKSEFLSKTGIDKNKFEAWEIAIPKVDTLPKDIAARKAELDKLDYVAMTKDEVVQSIDESRDWFNKAENDAMKEAMQRYTGSSYQWMNEFYREELDIKYLGTLKKQRLKAAEEAFEKAPLAFKKDVEVYRATGYSYIRNAIANDEKLANEVTGYIKDAIRDLSIDDPKVKEIENKLNNILVDRIVTEKSFTSTSYKYGAFGTSKPVQLKINAPKETSKAIQLASISGFGESEAEILFAPGMQNVIENVSFEPDKRGTKLCLRVTVKNLGHNIK